MKPSATNVQAEHGRHKNQSLPVGGWQKTAGDQHIWQLNHVPCSQNLDIDIWQTFLTKRAELCLLVWWWFVILLRFYMISGILLRACIVHTLSSAMNGSSICISHYYVFRVLWGQKNPQWLVFGHYGNEAILFASKSVSNWLVWSSMKWKIAYF